MNLVNSILRSDTASVLRSITAKDEKDEPV